MHKGSQETYEYIANWIDPKFFYSKNDIWHRMGMLGVFGDFVLSCTEGSIGEIGCGESSIYLSHLARKYNRRIHHCDIAPDKILNPLTVPGYMYDQPINMLNNPPYPGAFQLKDSFFFLGPSDEFFANLGDEKFALSFVDGDHIYAQAKKDFENFLARTVDNGYIMLHDTYPPDEEWTSENRCGDVYRLRQEIEKNPTLDSITLPRGCAMGVGLTICRKKPVKREIYHE